ncbi:MAG: O-antigen ligase family protein [Candidatus Pacebacteria bacterium]|nr:O-antigen ligase family protein [Candidatus Paceibacterota bacterium]
MLKKIENWLFYGFLFAIPISLRYIFGYEPFSFIEWTSVYIYATDILLFALLSFWFRRFLKIKNYKLEIKPADWLLLAFVVVAWISVGNAMNVKTAVFGWIKLVEGVALYFYVKEYALKRFNLSHAFEAIVAGATFQAVIAIIQFATQGSLGLKYLGESQFVPAMSGIAAFFVNGVKVVRAYGTTPHSNILALYLFIAIGAVYSVCIYQKRTWMWHLCHALILWAFFLTFSRVVIGWWVLIFVGHSLLLRFYQPFYKEFWLDPEMRRRGLGLFWTTIGVAVLFVACYWPNVINRSVISTKDEAVQLRVLYNNESLSSGQNIFGVGMGNFVPWLMTQDLHLNREVYQPVHNIYLLIYSEVGIVGVALFILFLALVLYDFYKRTGLKKLHHFYFVLIIVGILFFGLFDHYIWTIQTGRLMFWLALGLLAGAE